MHSAIYESYLVLWCCIDLWLIRAGVTVCHGYMYILLYMKLIQCSGVDIDLWSIRGEGWGQSAMGICAFCYIGN